MAEPVHRQPLAGRPDRHTDQLSGRAGVPEVERSLEWVDPRQTRLNGWITATRILAEHVGREVLVIARADQGAFSLAAQLYGMQAFLLEVGLGQKSAQIHRLLEFCNRYILRFADLLLEAGAHVVAETFLRFKGLERPGIIVTAAHLALEKPDYARRMYIALTRALATVRIVDCREDLARDGVIGSLVSG